MNVQFPQIKRHDLKKILSHTLDLVVLLLIVYFFNTCKKDDDSPGTELIFSKLRPAITSFIAKSDFNVSLVKLTSVRQIPSDDIDNAINEIIDNAAFLGDSSGIVKVYRLDSAMTPNPDTLAAVKSFYKRYLDTVIDKTDMVIVAVTWKINFSDTIITYGVVRNNGDIVYEPILDVCYVEPVTKSTGNKADTTYTEQQRFRWSNSYGSVVVDIRLDLKANSSDGCQATFSYALKSIQSAWPLDVKMGILLLTQYCEFKENCMCRTEPGVHNRMECATGSTTYEFTARSGSSAHAACIQWNPEYMKEYQGTISSSVCADGTK